MAKSKKTTQITFSVIIPCHSKNDICPELLPALKQQVFPATEILIVDDSKKTGSPGAKRDWAASRATGSVLAFIDSDAFPDQNWLSAAQQAFAADRKLAAVCGPGLTPANNNWRQKLSGFFYESIFTAGPLAFRNQRARARYVDDYPTSNLLVNAGDFKKAGGFATDLWPGEDTKLCHALTKKLNKKILYHPEILVFHHRRPVLLPHLQQIARFGQQRGYFARILPATSRKIIYLLPALLLFFLPNFWAFYAALLFLIATIKNNLLLFPITLISHITYGLFFLKGFVLKKAVNTN